MMRDAGQQSTSRALPTLQAWEGTAILLVDLDAFFASVEQLDHPGWRGKPVIVGGDADKHGVVSTASYEARAYGVHSAMPASRARQLCPQAIWASGRFDRYKAVSSAVMDILRRESPHVQQVSIDEAFVDVTPTRANREHPVAIARRIQERVEALGVTCSVGVGSSKTVAKIASDMDKPKGLTVVYPGSEHDFLSPLPVRALSGIGAASEQKLRAHGIETLGQIVAEGEGRMVRLFGKNGRTMFLRSCGCDDAPVAPDEGVKSVSNEMTFAEDLTARSDIEAALATMAGKVGRRLRQKGLKGKTVTVKLRFSDRTIHTAQRQIAQPTDNEMLFTPVLYELIEDAWRPGVAVRLVGVSISGFSSDNAVQESLFDMASLDSPNESASLPAQDESKRRGLLEATDKVRDRFGETAVRFGHELRNANNTTGTSAKNPADYK